MRKLNDDLKIDISDIFGGSLEPPSETIDEAEETPASTPVADAQFREWVTQRDQQLITQTQEIEQKIQSGSISSAPNPEPAYDPIAIEIPSTPIPTSSNPPIDFNAPIPMPFSVTTEATISTIDDQSAKSSDAIPELPSTFSAEEDTEKLKMQYEFLLLYDEFRAIIEHELKDLVGDKKTKTMLAKTFELSREKHPEYFRNANWDMAGNLLEDGRIESQRLVENKQKLDPKTADSTEDAALIFLLDLRFQAIEKGLGAGFKNKIRTRIFQWVTEKIQKNNAGSKDVISLKRLLSYIAV